MAEHRIQLLGDGGDKLYPKTKTKMGEVDGLFDKFADIEGGDYMLAPTSTAYTAKKYINSSGEIATASTNANFKVFDEKIPIPEYYRGKILKYYMYSNNNTQKTLTVAFYEDDDTFISGVEDYFGTTDYVRTLIPANAAYFKYSVYVATPDLNNYKFTFYDVVGSQLALSPISQRLARKEKDTAYMEPLGTLDNMLTGNTIISVATGSTHTFHGFMYNNAQGKLWCVQRGYRYLVGSGASAFTKKSFAIFKIKKTGVSGRTFAISTHLKNDGDDWTASASYYGFFDENTLPGTVVFRPNKNQGSTPGIVIRNEPEWIWVYIASNRYTNAGTTKADDTNEAYLYAFDSFTDSTHYTAGELVLDMDRSFCMVGEHSIDEDIASTFNIDRRYYTRPEKHNSQVKGKNVLFFGDSLGACHWALAQEWGMNVYTIIKGGCRMGYESGAGAGGETGTADEMWLCNDTWVQAVRTNVIAEGIQIDFIVCTAGHNGTLPESDATEVAYVADNAHKRWFDSDSETNPFDSLSSDNKLRFTGTACTFAAFYSLCKVYPYAIPVIVSHYRNMGYNVASTAANYTPEKFGNVLYNSYYYDRRAEIKDMAEKIGGLYVDCYMNSRSSVANLPAYYSSDSIHPTQIVNQDFGMQIGSAINEHAENEFFSEMAT